MTDFSSLCRQFISVTLVVTALALSGCASSPYQYSHPNIDSELSPSLVDNQQLYIGRPNRFLDASDWIWPGSLLAKLMLWNSQVDSHQISPEVVAALSMYLVRNELDDVMVLVNNYRPGIQWKRLFTNREVGAGWRYTLGILSVTNYTILPGRFFGGDHFNPYTNTISIFSNDVGIALHEAAHAKDFNSRKYKGLHAFLYSLPGAALYYEAVASNDALSYLQNRCEFAHQKEAYRTLHPAYATYVGGTLSNFVLPTSYLAYLATIPGHITGNIAAARLNPEALSAALPCGAELQLQGELEGDSQAPASTSEVEI